MVVLECLVFGSIAAVVVSELYLLKKLFTDNNFPYVNNSTPTPITSLFSSRSEYAWGIELQREFESWCFKNVTFKLKKQLVYIAQFQFDYNNYNHRTQNCQNLFANMDKGDTSNIQVPVNGFEVLWTASTFKVTLQTARLYFMTLLHVRNAVQRLKRPFSKNWYQFWTFMNNYMD